MPPTTEEFEKLIDLGRLLRALGAGGVDARGAAPEFLALLPGLRAAFGPAFPPAVHRELDAIEAAIREDRLIVAEIEVRAGVISGALGIPLAIGA